MKKIILITCFFLNAIIATAQTCMNVQGMTPIPVQFGINIYGNPESVLPMIPLNWNRYYTVDMSTGNLVPLTCAYTGDPNITGFAYCACFLSGACFRKVTPVCDATPCGGDLNLPQLPITNNNSSSNNWSQPATWLANQVPDISSSLSVMISKSTLIDDDLSFSNNNWLIFSSGNSSILTGKTITCNSVIQIYAAAQLENFGTLKGSGKIVGSLLNSGTLSPGNSPGKFSITGNYTATSTAVQQVEIASADLYDTIDIVKDISAPSGNAVLNGTLNVSLLNGYTPSLGDTYKIMTFTSSTGNFINTNLPALPIGLSWDINYNPTDITLKVTAIVVPLSIKYTRAYKHGTGVMVEWATENEINVKNYEIEKSLDGIQFNRIGTIHANGGSANRYEWFDALPVKANNYYRIKAIDIDDKFIYSPVQLIKNTNENEISVYPYPVKRTEALQVNLQNITATQIVIINTNGQELYHKTGKLTGTINIAIPGSWPAGQYIVKIVTENKVKTEKIMVR